jgi:hypothetical protein
MSSNCRDFSMKQKYLLLVVLSFLFHAPNVQAGEIIRPGAGEFSADYTAYNAKLNNSLAGGDLGSIITAFLPSILTIAGFILFAMLVFGGFTMLAGAANKDSQEKGKKMVTGALTGFGIIFMAYWIAQILQIIFKVSIVS